MVKQEPLLLQDFLAILSGGDEEVTVDDVICILVSRRSSWSTIQVNSSLAAATAIFRLDLK